ncbi:MAG: S8 family serine peptidase, partial [Actinomycetota bacterium]|nr:S8 family serine peptidase [Actinomycetota bacterium]
MSTKRRTSVTAFAAALAVTAGIGPATAAQPSAGPVTPQVAAVAAAVPTPGDPTPVADANGDYTVVATVVDAQGRPTFVPVTADTPAEAERRAEAVPGTVDTAPDVRVRALGTVDPYRSQLWAINAMQLDTLPAVDLSGTKVAVVDSGILASHEDFAPAQVRCDLGLDNTEDGPNASGCTDPNGHGTHVAGTIGAVKDNGKGIFGVAPGVEIIPIRSLATDGYGWTSDIANGIRHAVDKGAHVINLSLGGGYSSMYDDAVAYATSKNVLVVAAAGNNRQSGNTPNWPGASPGALTVAATDRYDVSASFSYSGPEVDIAGPGLNIYSTAKSGAYTYMSGTSMATPHVAGAAALYRAAFPAKTQAEVQAALVRTTKDIEIAGRDNNTGAGLIDIKGALTEGQQDVKVAPNTPTNAGASPGDRSALVSWDAVAATQNAPVEGYRVYRDRVLHATVTGTSFTDTGLTNGTDYMYEVTAYGVGGESPRSLPSVATPRAPYVAPAAPASVTATAGDATATVSWSAVTGTDSAHVGGYKVYRDGTAIAVTTMATTATSYTDNDVTNGTTYTYEVAAYGAGGESARSAAAPVTPKAP